MDATERLVFAAALVEARERGLVSQNVAAAVAPASDEALLDAVQELTGHRIPRVAVCTDHGHVAPATTFCDLFFGRVTNCLWIGNRGGGKTANSGQLHGAKNRWNPGYTSAMSGAVEKQAGRGYAEFRKFTRQCAAEVASSIMSKTVWVNRSETEVLGGTVSALNGPHPHFAQMDEVELSNAEAFEEFLNMAQGTADYPGQQLLTSTRKKAHGLVQAIVTECTEAMRQGVDPPWRVDIFCVFETLAKVPECRMAGKKERQEALKACGQDTGKLCNCHKVRKGSWDDGMPRTFETVCRGRAFRSDGFVQLPDAQKRFKQLSRMTWEAQQECLTPNVEGIVHKWMNEKVSLSAWLPKPQFGSIYRGWDWGGQNPNVVVWFQLLDVPVGLNAEGLPTIEDEDAVRVIPEGSMVQFDEIYKTSDELPGDGGYSDLGDYVAFREEQWRDYGFPMEIAGDYCDPAGFIAKREVKKAYKRLIESGEHDTLKVPNFKSAPAPVVESVRMHISWGEGERIFIVEGMCPHTSDEYDTYHWPDKKDGKNDSEAPVKDDDHAMDATRYLIFNLETFHGRSAGGEIPGAAEESKGITPPGQFAPLRAHPSESPVAAKEKNAPSRVRETPYVSTRSGGSFR